MAQPGHMAGMAGMSATTAAGQGPRAQAMRLHDAAMSRLDALATERQRLAGALAQLGAARPTRAGPPACAAPWPPSKRPTGR